MGFFDFIAIFGLVQGLLIAVIIFTNKVFKNESNHGVAYFLIILAVIGLDARFGNSYSSLGKNWADFLDIVGDDIPWVMMVYLPLFRFFVHNVKNLKMRFPFWWLYTPFGLFIIFNGIIDLDLEFGLISAPFFTDNRVIFYRFEDYISIILFFSLHILVLINSIKHNENKWIKRLWWYMTILLVAFVILVIDQAFFNDAFFKPIEQSFWAIVTAFTYWLMYSGLFQFNLANNRQEIRARLETPAREDTPRKTGLSVKSKAYFDQLMELMLVDKVYRDPDIGRESVAQQLGISVSYLTQLIKEYTEKNFTGFVNEFRVEEAKKMLLDPTFDTFDHLSIGLEAGFKSKSAYYTAFKNFSGKTPSQFKKES